MTRDDRLSIYQRDLGALMQQDNAFVIFHLQGDEDSYVQFSREGSRDPLYCEVSNRTQGWNTHSLDSAQVAALRDLGYVIPSPHHQSNPHKEFSGDVRGLAAEVEKIFRQVFGAAEDYTVVSNRLSPSP